MKVEELLKRVNDSLSSKFGIYCPYIPLQIYGTINQSNNNVEFITRYSEKKFE